MLLVFFFAARVCEAIDRQTIQLHPKREKKDHYKSHQYNFQKLAYKITT